MNFQSITIITTALVTLPCVLLLAQRRLPLLLAIAFILELVMCFMISRYPGSSLAMMNIVLHAAVLPIALAVLLYRNSVWRISHVRLFIVGISLTMLITTGLLWSGFYACIAAFPSLIACFSVSVCAFLLLNRIPLAPHDRYPFATLLPITASTLIFHIIIIVGYIILGVVRTNAIDIRVFDAPLYFLIAIFIKNGVFLLSSFRRSESVVGR